MIRPEGLAVVQEIDRLKAELQPFSAFGPSYLNVSTTESVIPHASTQQ
jgi:hypothetical protein